MHMLHWMGKKKIFRVPPGLIFCEVAVHLDGRSDMKKKNFEKEKERDV